MQDRPVRRRWSATLVGSVAVLALAAGCTGDDGVEVIADDRDPMDVLAAAAESLPTSGRIRATIEMDLSGWSDIDDEAGDEEMPSSFRSTVDMEFNGDRSRLRSSVEPDAEGLGTYESEVLQVGDAAYVTAASLLDMFDPEQSGEDVTPEDLEMLESARAVIGDRRWVRFGEDDGGVGMFTLLGTGVGAEGQEQWLDPATIFEELTGVTELDPIVSDGAQVRVFRGTYEQPGWSGEELDDFGEPYSEEEAARIERIEAYGRERTGTEVVVQLDDQGRLRRIETTSRDDVEEQYRDCMLLFSMGEHSAVIEYSDFGADIAIEEPDPATVVDVAELARDDGGLGLYLGLDAPVPDDESEWSDEAEGGTTTTAFGPEDLASFLREMHGPTLSDGAALIGLDPATIPTMSEDEILDAVERLDEARRTQPTTQTALGLQDRIGMLELIRSGVDMLGLEPIPGLEAMTDQQLAGLIDSYVAANGAPVGAEPGEWSPEDYEDPAFSEDDEDFEDYDEFEGCPA